MSGQNHLINRVSATELSAIYLYWVTMAMVILASVIQYVIGYYGGDLDGENYKVNHCSLLFFTILYVIGLYGSYHVSRLMSRLKFSRYHVNFRSKHVLSFVFVFFSLMVVFFALWGGVGTINRGVQTNRYAELFFALFDPYILMILMIYFVYLNFGKSLYDRVILSLLVVIYLFLTIRSGFTSFLILLLPVFFLMLLSFMSKVKAIIIMIVALASFPFIRIGKWIVGGFSLSDINSDLILVATRGVIERFSAVPNMIFINDFLVNKDVFLQTSYLPFFQGYLGSFFHKLFFLTPVSLNTLYLHQIIHDTTTDSNSTFPILSYFSLDIYIGVMSLLYFFFLIFVLSYLLNIIFGRSILGRGLMCFFLFYVVFFYAFNGWFWSVCGVIQSSILFIILLALIGKITSYKRLEI